MKNPRIKATSLRTVMIVSILIIITILTVGFYFAQDWLNTQIAESDKTTIGSSVVNKNAASVKKIQDEITKYQASATKANTLIVSSQDYQSQIIQDLKKYAAANNITISTYSFSQSTSSDTKASVSIKGVTSNFINITLNDSIKLTNLIKFLKSIEVSVPKMQLTGINVTPIPNSQDSVRVEPLTIEVYTK